VSDRQTHRSRAARREAEVSPDNKAFVLHTIRTVLLSDLPTPLPWNDDIDEDIRWVEKMTGQKGIDRAAARA
jgi:hypothetical protein